jgi:hypothetical protein
VDGVVAEPKKPKIKLPEGVRDEQAFLSDMRGLFADDITHDRENREAALQDLKFLAGDQWDADAKQRRDTARKPTLTFNRLIAYVAQVVGNRRLNETVIRVLPDHGGEKQAAEVREGLIRSIQKLSRAEIAYDKALENSTICGIGNFQLHLDYTDDDVFEQELKIAAIPDALAVVWDRMALDPTGSDANHCFVIDSMPEAEFKDRWPWARCTDIEFDSQDVHDWFAEDTVRIVSFWKMKTRKRQIALMNDGKVVDITDAPDEILNEISSRPDGTPYIREVERPYACMYLCSGADILAGPYELPIKRVPVFRVPGWELNVGGKRMWWGLVRFLKDPQRLHNYWRSTVAERLMMAPRAKWIAASNAVEGREAEWRQSHLSDDPLLVYNADAGQPPIPVPPAQFEQALVAEGQMSVQDMRDISNLHEANLGMPSNEVSGKAIIARQRIGDLGTVIYHDNLNAAIEQCGTVINDLIPIVYDTPRTVRILGPDGKDALQAINDVGDSASIDIASGKYAVTLATGASYLTKRVEAAETLLSLVNSVPQVGMLAMDLVFEALDIPGAENLAKRFRKTLPPGMVPPDDMSPEEQQMAMGQAQAAQQQQQVQQAAITAEIMNKQADTAMKAAKAQESMAKAQSVGPKLQLETAQTVADVKAKAMKSVNDLTKATISAAKPASGSKR